MPKSSNSTTPSFARFRDACRTRTSEVIAISALLLACATGTHAAVIGYHDLSDPVKTMGWVCETDAPTALRIYMFAETTTGRKLLDTQVADKRRDDLAGICPGGSGHAFRFSDYAVNADGIALYQTIAPSTIRVMVETAEGLVDLAGTPRTVSFAPVGIWDANLTSGRWRTDHDNPVEGTSAAPLLLGDCAYAPSPADGNQASSGGGDALSGCPDRAISSPASNAATSDAHWPQHSFWAVIANIENSFDNPSCVDGPPGQSGAIRAPGAGGLFGLLSLPDDETGAQGRRKMHLVLNSSARAECRRQGYEIPHLSFGAQADRGNNGVLTYLNSRGAKTLLRFGMTLMDIADRRPDAFVQPTGGGRRASEAQFVVEALWGGRKRWMIVEVLPDPRNENAQTATIDTRVRFSWPLVNSFLYPGADYVYKSASVLSAQCAAEGVVVPTMDRSATYVDPVTRDKSRQDYAIDLQKAFACLDRLGAWGSEPMPAHPIPITGVHFGIGQDDAFYRDGVATGQRSANAIWIAVDGVRLE